MKDNSKKECLALRNKRKMKWVLGLPDIYDFKTEDMKDGGSDTGNGEC